MVINININNEFGCKTEIWKEMLITLCDYFPKYPEGIFIIPNDRIG